VVVALLLSPEVSTLPKLVAVPVVAPVLVPELVLVVLLVEPVVAVDVVPVSVLEVPVLVETLEVPGSAVASWLSPMNPARPRAPIAEPPTIPARRRRILRCCCSLLMRTSLRAEPVRPLCGAPAVPVHPRLRR
jgi:hypothetical protein